MLERIKDSQPIRFFFILETNQPRYLETEMQFTRLFSAVVALAVANVAIANPILQARDCRRE